MTFEDLKDEIKREAFFKKLQKYLPIVVLLALAILVFTGVMTWRAHDREKTLVQAEALYEEALSLKKQGKKAQAIALFKDLEKKHKGIFFLCQLQLSALDQPISDVQETHLWLYEFLTMAKGMAHLTPLGTHTLNFKSPQSAWHDLYGLYQSLISLSRGNVSDLLAPTSWVNRQKDRPNPIQHFFKIGLMEA